MTRWIKLAIIKRLNNDGDLVATDATGSLSYDELSDVFNGIKNKSIKVVPPMIDFSNNLDVKNATSKSDHLCLTLNNSITKDAGYDMKGRYIIASQDDVGAVVGINLPKNALVGMDAFDSNGGYVGVVSDIEGSSFQKCLSIKTQDNDENILVPYVDQYINKIEGNTIYLNLNDDLINLNKK